MDTITKLWFWLLLLSIIGFIITFISFEITAQTIVPSWIWIVFGISIAIVIIAFILYAVDLYDWNRKREIAIACGEIPEPLPVRYVTCPKKCPEQNSKKLECPKQVNIIREEIIENPRIEVFREVVVTKQPLVKDLEDIDDLVPIQRGLLTDDRFSSTNLLPLRNLPL